MAVDGMVTPEVLKVLGEPVRWRIAERLAGEELCVCHLVEDLGLTQPLVSHHLKVLRDAGLVTSERYRQWTYYRLVGDSVTAVSAALDGLAQGAGATGQRRRPCC